MHADGFNENTGAKAGTFAFRNQDARERLHFPRILMKSLSYFKKHEKDNGKIVWVMGPASFDIKEELFRHSSKTDMLMQFLAGNALGLHDL